MDQLEKIIERLKNDLDTQKKYSTDLLNKYNHAMATISSVKNLAEIHIKKADDVIKELDELLAGIIHKCDDILIELRQQNKITDEDYLNAISSLPQTITLQQTIETIKKSLC